MLSFNGTADIWTAGVGSIALPGAASIAVACRINEDVEGAGLFTTWTAANAIVVNFFRRSSSAADPNTLCYETAASNSRAVSFVAADGYCVVGVNKATGTTAPRFHKVPIVSGNASTHGASATTVGNAGGTASKVIVGAWGDGSTSQFSSVDVICAAWWNSSLSDGNFDTLKNGFDAWLALSPVDMWTFSSTTTVKDMIGTGDESSRTGTTIGDNPDPFNNPPNRGAKQLTAVTRSGFF